MVLSHTLDVPGASLVYDVHGTLPPADGRPVLLMVGQPMEAGGFAALASHLPDRTVVAYDPRGLGRSTRSDGEVSHSPTVQAEDLHALVKELGAGPVEVFASSGGAVTALALVTAYPEDVVTLVAHEPPLTATLPDAELARRATEAVTEVYRARGWGAGMAAFVALTSWQGQITEDFLAQPPPDPAQLGLPAGDDGSRDDPLLGDRSRAVTDYQPDVRSLTAAPTRIVIGVGKETGDAYTARTARATARLLGLEPVVFPGGHGGFAGEEDPWPGRASEFAVVLREVLAGG